MFPLIYTISQIETRLNGIVLITIVIYKYKCVDGSLNR